MNDANVSHMAHHGSLSGPALVIGSIYMEGFSSDKAEMLSSVCNKCDIVCMQETHRGHNHRRPSSKGMKLLAEIQHDKYGSAIFSRPDLPIEYTHTANSEDNIKIITVFPHTSQSPVYTNLLEVGLTTIGCHLPVIETINLSLETSTCTTHVRLQ